MEPVTAGACKVCPDHPALDATAPDALEDATALDALDATFEQLLRLVRENTQLFAGVRHAALCLTKIQEGWLWLKVDSVIKEEERGDSKKRRLSPILEDKCSEEKDK